MYKSVETQSHIWSNCINNYQGEKLFGYEWGDPEESQTRNVHGNILGDYKKIKDEYLVPNINGKHVVDIGSLGGKWLPAMVNARQITCVDITSAGFDYIKNKVESNEYKLPTLLNLKFYHTSGDELSGIDSGSVDFIFSIDALVRSEPEIFRNYLREFKRVLSGDGKACVHLPCREQKMSYEFGFTPITKGDIKDMCIAAGFPQSYRIDMSTVNHGVLLLLNF